VCRQSFVYERANNRNRHGRVNSLMENQPRVALSLSLPVCAVCCVCGVYFKQTQTQTLSVKLLMLIEYGAEREREKRVRREIIFLLLW
jgi:hypothetical protein